MINFRLTVLRFAFGKVSDSLKILQLTPPTNKKQIKTKYLQMAKQLHPDTNEQENQNKSKQQKKEQNQAFIQLTSAYKYLNQLNEEEINNPKQETQDPEFSDYKGETSQNAHSEEYPKAMSEQERARRNTYAYFNRKYRKQQPQQQMQKVPLYRQLPELFLGMAFVFAFFCEWAYYAIKRSQRNKKQKDGDNHKQTLSTLNFKKRYNRKQSQDYLQ